MKFNARRSLRRMAAGAVAVPLVLLGLSACGTEGGSSANADSIILTASQGDEITPTEFVSEFKKMYENEDSVKTVIEVDAAGQQVSMEGAIDWSDGTKAQMNMTVMGMDVEAIMVDGVMYMKGMDPTGKYIKMDLDKLGGMTGIDYTKQMNPAEAMDTFKDAITQVVYRGTEEVEGTELRHYAVTVDVAKMMASTTTDDSLVSGMDLPEEITQDVYLDDSGLLRRLEMKGEGSMPSTTMTFSDYGLAVDVSAPASDQVTEMPDLGSMMETPAA